MAISGKVTLLPGRTFNRHFCFATIALLGVAYVWSSTSCSSATAVQRLCFRPSSNFPVHKLLEAAFTQRDNAPLYKSAQWLHPGIAAEIA